MSSVSGDVPPPEEIIKEVVRTPASKTYIGVKKLKSKGTTDKLKHNSPARHPRSLGRLRKKQSQELEPTFEIGRDQIEEAHTQIEALLGDQTVIDPVEIERRIFKERIAKQMIDDARERCRKHQLETNYKNHYLLDRGFNTSLNKASKTTLLHKLNEVPADPDVAGQSRVLLTNPDFKRYFDLDKKMFGSLDGVLVDSLTHTRMKEKGEIANEQKRLLSYYEGLLVLGEDQVQKLSLMRKHQSYTQQQRILRMQANKKFFDSFDTELARADKFREQRKSQSTDSHYSRNRSTHPEMSTVVSEVDLVEYAKSGGQRRGLSIVERFMRRTIQQTEKATFHLDEVSKRHAIEKRRYLEELKQSGILERSKTHLLAKPRIRIVPADESLNKSMSKLQIGGWKTNSSFLTKVNKGFEKPTGTGRMRTSQSFEVRPRSRKTETQADDHSQVSSTVQEKADLLNRELEGSSIVLSKTALSLLEGGLHLDKKKLPRHGSPSHLNRTMTREVSITSKKSFETQPNSKPDRKPIKLIKGSLGISIQGEPDPLSRALSRGQSFADLEKHIEEEKTRLLARANKLMLARSSSSSSKIKPVSESVPEGMDLDQQAKRLLFLQDRGKYIDDHHILDREEMEVLAKLTKHHKRSHRLAAYRDSHQTVYLNEAT